LMEAAKAMARAAEVMAAAEMGILAENEVTAVTAKEGLAEVVREVMREVVKVVSALVEAADVMVALVEVTVVVKVAVACTAGTQRSCQSDGSAAERFAVEPSQTLPW
jgi:hypothetical protein